MKKVILIVALLSATFVLPISFFSSPPQFSSKFGKQVKSDIDQQKLEWGILEEQKSETTTFSKSAFYVAAFLFFLGASSYSEPYSKNEANVDFGEICLTVSALMACVGVMHEYIYGKNTICQNQEGFRNKLKELDEYIAVSNKKMDGSKVLSSRERERVTNYMNELKAEWKQKLDACKKSKN